jgi:hypothetical protein
VKERAMKSLLLAIGAAAVHLGASAAPPENLAGTTWTVQINRGIEQLVITAQGGAGAPGAAKCRALIGTIGIAPVRGWYCPDTGRFSLLHKNLDSGVTMRVFSGHVSDEVVGQPLYLGGTVAVHYPVPAFGDLGEVNFSGVK